MKKRTLHLLPNAHIDPVWLWNWREELPKQFPPAGVSLS